MGSHTFKWEHPAEEVYVTGTFDNWTKSVKLDKVDGVFQKTVPLTDVSQKIYYKFVVDNTWTTNDSAPKEPDHEGNINNFLTPDQVSASLAADSLISNVTPDSTTAIMAGQQSKKAKKKKSKSKNAGKESQESFASNSNEVEETPTPADIPGGFPVTPGAELGINPLPAAAGAVNPVSVEAGEKVPESVTAQDINDNVKLDKESYEKSDALPGGVPASISAEADKPIGINPLPAAAGAVNPIHLEPGQEVPRDVTAQDINQHVKLDKESYEKSDTLPGPPSGLPSVAKNIIPESGLPIVDAAINSVAPAATTVAMAGIVPLESKVPAVVKESQEKAGASPEASAIPEEVKEKALVEKELKARVPEAPSTSEGADVPVVVKQSQEQAGASPEASAIPEEVREKAEVEAELKAKVPEAPSTSEGISGIGTQKTENTGPIVAAAATTGGAVLAAVAAAAGTVAEKAAPVVDQATNAAIDAANANLPDSVKDQLPESAQEVLATHNKEAIRQEIAPAVPEEVKESITESGKSPEAAVNAEAVADKKVVEAELLREVHTAPGVGDPSATVSQPEVVKVAKLAPALAATDATPAASHAGETSDAKEISKPEETPKAVEAAKVETAPKADTTPKTDTTPKVEDDSKPEETLKTDEVKAEPVANGAEASKTEASKTEAPKTEAASNGAGASNGTGSKPEASKSTEAATADKKKKNRFSAILSKIKHKITDKN